MKRIVMLLGLIAVFLTFNGCAALFNRKEVAVPISSTPNGAKVYVNGNYVGTSPVEVNLSVRDSYTVSFKKEGYEDRTYFINNSVGGGWVVLDVLGGFIPIIVDAATGSWYELSTDSVDVPLEEK